MYHSSVREILLRILYCRHSLVLLSTHPEDIGQNAGYKAKRTTAAKVSIYVVYGYPTKNNG